MIKLTRFRSLVAFVMIAVLSLGAVSAQEGDNFLRVNWGANPIPHLDPSLATDVSSIQVITELFPGLTRVEEVSLETQPGMATWTVGDDGLTYTFSLLENVPWVQFNPETGEVEEFQVDGETVYVTANDFKFGMMKSMDPRTGSYYGGVLSGWISGGSAYNGSIDDVADDASDEEVAALVDAAADGVAITVVNDYTLEIVASQEAGFVPQILGLWMATAQPAPIVNQFGDAWTEFENLVSYGPFTLSEWSNGDRVTMVRNPFWAGTETIPVPALDGVTGIFVDPAGGLANYEAGEIDVVGVPSADLDRVLADPTLGAEYTTGPDSCTFYLGVNSTKSPTDDVRVRQALSMSIDRQAIADAIIRPSSPAFFFARPSLAAAPSQEEFSDAAIGEDDEMARALIEEYVAETGELPEISFMHSAGSSSGPLLAAAVQEMWNDALGDVTVNVTTQEWAVYLETTDVPETAPNLWYIGWCLDYPDAHNFLFDVWHSSVIDNGTGFQNDEFDAILEEAATLTDLDERAALYARAEEILTNEAAVVIPLVYDQTSRLTKPYVERPYGVLSNTYYEDWSLNNE